VGDEVDRTYNAVDAGDGDHPAIARLRSELDAARRGIREIGAVGAEHRERIVAAIRSAVPDAAGRAAFEVGRTAAIDVIRGFVAPDLRSQNSAAARLWDEIVADATEAARSSDGACSGAGRER
jgi:hypothetical protein